MARVLCGVGCIVWLIVVVGCAGPSQEERQIWEQVKITELAPTPGAGPARAEFFATVRIDIHVIELPADNIDQLDELWDMLSVKPIRMSSYNAFSQNSFRVKYGRMDLWEPIRTRLAEAAAQNVARTSLAVVDNDTSDFTVAELLGQRSITFVGTNLSRQSVTVGPGTIVLRLRAEPIPWARGVRKIIAYPTYTLPVRTAITPLQMRARKNEFYFASAAFALQMGPGDLLVLGPDQYTGEQMTLGGLFFSHPQGSLFFNPGQGKPPEHKPAIRLYILTCTGIND